MRTVTIKLGETNVTEINDNTPWYVRAENAVKESVREVSINRQVATQTREALRDELDKMYADNAKAMMVKLMAKRGLDIKFD